MLHDDHVNSNGKKHAQEVKEFKPCPLIQDIITHSHCSCWEIAGHLTGAYWVSSSIVHDNIYFELRWKKSQPQRNIGLEVCLTGRLLTMWLNLKPGRDSRGFFELKSHSGPTCCCFPEKGIEFRAMPGQSRTTFPDSSNTGGKLWLQLITRAFKH